MKTLRVDLAQRSYDIHIEQGSLEKAGQFVRARCPKATRAALVTDSNVRSLYGAPVADALGAAGLTVRGFVVPAGESSKAADRLAQLWEDLMDFGLTRADVVVALGGGVVGDLAGFAAATALRGVDLIQIPTTLLAQVDSSVGGKVAIDLRHGKNLAGAFYQPKGVLMDPETLDTLDDKTFSDGMAEVIKYGCIADEAFFDFLAARPGRSRIMGEIEHVLYTCCDIKRKVVEEDERDTGARMMLNFGHTLGHAYELAGGYTRWTHGQAVAAGMVRAAELGVALGVTPADIPQRVRSICQDFGLPTAIDCGHEDYAAAIGLDKKSAGGDISLILLERMGHAVAHKMEKETLLRLL